MRPLSYVASAAIWYTAVFSNSNVEAFPCRWISRAFGTVAKHSISQSRQRRLPRPFYHGERRQNEPEKTVYLGSASESSQEGGIFLSGEEDGGDYQHELLDDLLTDKFDQDVDSDHVEYDVDSDDSFNSTSSITLDDLSAAFSSNVSYFYLQNELCLSEEALWRITNEAGSIFGMTTDTIRRKVDVLRQNMNLDDDDVRSILERQPTILHLSADKNIAPTILFLVRALDLGKDELRSLVLASPCILAYRKDNLKSKINFFTQLMGFSVEDCRDLFLAEPKLVRAGVRTGLVPRMRFLVRDMEIPMDKLREIVQKHPRILLYSLDGNLVPKLIYYLIMTLHMSTAQVQKLLLSYPDVLKYNLDRHIIPITQFFIKDLEFSAIEFRTILLKFPRLVTHSLQKIKHVVGYLRFELGLTASQVKRVLYQFPQVIGLNTEGTLKSKVNFLRTSFGLSDEQLRRVVAGMPTLLSLNVDRNLQPKIEFVRQSFGGNNILLRDAILRLPTLLGYSFEKRLRPRMEEIIKAGVDPSSITVGVPMKQDQFEGWLHRRGQKDRRKRSAIVPVEVSKSESLESDRSGRIVHWTRERRSPSTR